MPIESIGDQVNLPPYYTSDYTEPAPDLIIEFDPEEEALIEFNTGPIGDPNPNDRIYWRWFVDYRAETSDLPIEFSEANGATPRNSSMVSARNSVRAQRGRSAYCQTIPFIG